jgi:hypothetical protein
MIKKLIILTLIVFLMGCAEFHPRLGMTYDDWLGNKNASFEYVSHKPKMVGAEGNMEVWTLTENGFETGVYYYFEHGQLVKIDQGQLKQERMQLEQERMQLEIINKYMQGDHPSRLIPDRLFL